MYNDLVMNTMHMFNEKAKLRGFTNGISWAKAAFEAGELTDNELIILGTLHTDRNNMAHGQAGKILHTEEDYQFLLDILSKFDKSQLRADGDSWEEWEEYVAEPATPEEIEEWFREGAEYYNQMLYEEAVKYYRKAAAQGHSDALNSLGICYALGQGVPKDDGKAVKWYRKAAEQGNLFAQNNLGVRYLYGDVVEKDWSKAVSLFQNAAEQGNAYAQYNLAECYFWGKGIEKDNQEAFRQYEKAAEQGYARAMGRLGDCYYDGKGVAQDYEKAFSWYQKGAEKKDGTSLNGLGNCYYYGHGVEKNIGTAKDNYRQAAEDGNPFAQLRLACIYKEYSKDPEDQYTKYCKEEADKWLTGARRAFEARLQNGSAEEYYAYACIFENKDVWHKDPHCKLAASSGWAAKAAEMGHVDAMTERGIDLISTTKVWDRSTGGYVSSPDPELEGRKMLFAAATQGSAKAMRALGVNYVGSKALNTNPTEGGKWLLKAEMRGYLTPAHAASYLDQFLEGHMTPALVQELRECSEQGYASASRYLSLCYENGYGVEKNEQEARRYLQLAADQGDSEAQRLLAAMSSENEEAIAAAKELNKLIKAANGGDLEAQYQLAGRYAKGEGVEKNEEEAFKWYKKAADQDVIGEETRYLACYEVGYRYEHGIGVEKDATEMLKYYGGSPGGRENARISKTLPDEKRAEMLYRIGHCLLNGIGTWKDYSRARKYYCWAAELGHKQAKKELLGVSIMSLFKK